MADKRYEQISALLDDELSTDEMHQILGDLKQDPLLVDAWDRYALIGDALRGEGARVSAEGISSRVTAALADEPAIISRPSSIDNADEADTGNSVIAAESRWVRPVAGAALAASVAALAIFIVPGFQTTSDPVGNQIADASQASLPAPSSQNQQMRWKNLQQPSVASKLDRYLREHSEYASPGGMSGVLPYASFVSYDSAER